MFCVLLTCRPAVADSSQKFCRFALTSAAPELSITFFRSVGGCACFAGFIAIRQTRRCRAHVPSGRFRYGTWSALRSLRSGSLHTAAGNHRSHPSTSPPGTAGRSIATGAAPSLASNLLVCRVSDAHLEAREIGEVLILFSLVYVSFVVGVQHQRLDASELLLHSRRGQSSTPTACDEARRSRS